MDTFNELRRQAREKRDRIVQRARDEHADILAKIDALERQLLGPAPPKRRSDAASIESVIPRDRPFTIAELMAALEVADDSRPWNRRNVQTYVSILRSRGLVRRLRKPSPGVQASFARVEARAEAEPFAEVTLADAIAQVLQAGPMNPPEIIIALRESGYPSKSSRKNLLNAIAYELRRGAFEKVGGKWRAGA